MPQRPSDRACCGTRCVHVAISANADATPLGLTRAPLAELSGQVGLQQTASNPPVGKPISLASVQVRISMGSFATTLRSPHSYADHDSHLPPELCQ